METPSAGAAPAWERVDTGPLSWVMTELRESLDRSLEALKTFSQNPEDSTSLKLAKSSLHQAHGALQIVNLEGVSLLTEEVEGLLETFDEDAYACTAEVVDAIGASYRSITEYLEELLAGEPHQPVRLFPSYRALLGMRNADRIHPADLFYPDLSIRPPKDASGTGPQLSVKEIAVQRTRFERALLLYLRDETNKQAMQEMCAAVTVIESSPKQGQQRAFWWVTKAFFEALSAGAVPADLNVKRLCARINLQIRRLLEGSGTVAERLLRDTLFFVARSNPATPHIAQVQDVYRLENSLPEDFEVQRYGRINFAALRSAKEALTGAKSAWSLVVAGDAGQISAFSRDASALLTAAGALGNAGLAAVAQVVASIGTELSFDPRKPADAVGLDVATALLFLEGALDQVRSLDDAFDARAQAVVARVESSALGMPAGAEDDVPWLDEISRRAQERLTMASFVAEMQTNLRTVEKSLDTFFRDPTQRAELPQADKLLGQIGGALAVLGHEDAGRAIEGGRAAIAQFQSETYQADQKEFERVAESLGAVGFYIESLLHRTDLNQVFRFDPATGSFSADLARTPKSKGAGDEEPEPDPEPSGPGGLPASSGPETAFPAETTVEQEIARHGDAVAALAETLRANPGDAAAREELARALHRVQQDALLVDDSSLKERAGKALQILHDTPAGNAELSRTVFDLTDETQRFSEGAENTATAPIPQITAPVPTEEASIDAELLSVFLEEAEEVLENARTALMNLAATPSDQAELTTIRRAFHTLKGSGRMVGLKAFGEAGWGMEQTLNHWLAEAMPATPDLIALIKRAINELDSWVEELADDGHSSRTPDALCAAAKGLRDGRPLTAAERVPDKGLSERPEPTMPTPLAVEQGFDSLTTEVIAPQTLGISDEDYLRTEVLAQDKDQPPEFQATEILPPEPDEAGAAQMDEAFSELFPPLDLPVGAPLPASPMPAAATPLAEFSGAPMGTPVGTPIAAPQAAPSVPVAPMAPAEPVHVVASAPQAPAPFEPPSQPGPRLEEFKQVGTLTLSVPLYNIYLTEADELLRALRQDFSEWRHESNRGVAESSVRAAHSLAGTSATVGIAPVHDLAYAVEAVLQLLLRSPVPIDIDEIGILQDGVRGLEAMLRQVAGEEMPDPNHALIDHLFGLRDLLKERFADSQGPRAAPAGDLLASDIRGGLLLKDEAPGEGVLGEGFAPEAPELSEPLFPPEREAPAVPDFTRTEVEPVEDEPVDSVGIELPLADLAPAAAGDAPGEALTHPAPEAADHPLPGFELAFTPEETAQPAASDAPETPDSAAEPVVEPQSLRLDEPVGDPFGEPFTEPFAEGFAAQPAPGAAEPAMAGEPALSSVPSNEETAAVLASALEALKPAEPAPQDQRLLPIEAVSHVRDEIDPELIQLFIQEASEYLPQIGEALRNWQQAPSTMSHPQALMRMMHTVKGSARMAGAMRLGELVHNMETRVESAVNLRDIPVSAFEELLAAHDRALELFDNLVNPPPLRRASDLSQGVAARDEIEIVPAPVVAPLPDIEVAARAPVPAATVQAFARAADTARAQVQAVRVRADVLDRLVNQAGEVSISRSRLENEVSQIKSSLGDLTENLVRLRGQLREIEIQAETQMQSQLSLAKERERFDPLEFDRFTRLQELTRMMAESVNDVATVHQNLLRSLDGANRDLVAQQRMTRDLQQDLMRVRMVPFSSVSERLYRVVRQTAKELDKRVNLDIRGGGVEIDRSVLERMVAPFEHLLRNAIVHGVEGRSARVSAGKNETGELLVEVRQEGNEIVIVFSDDGAGLNLERIREKGRSAGLIEADEEVTDARAADLIFQPGFSTAAEVTELAGRGVGMDVVRAEASGLGGRVSVDSTTGQGTRFTINLPLTLAVTQVVLVNVGGRTFALPSVLVEQVQQLRPQPLAQAYNDGQIMWLGQPVKLYFLAGLLGERDRSPIAQRYSPVLILRSGGERIAVHVDEVVGNQEVVVKNIGPQLARMIGVAGATVLGSGDIVLILNPVQLAQQVERERPHQPHITLPEIGGAVAELVEAPSEPSRAEPVAGLETLPIVMVVDDSLTVRRVTQRLLTREGYQVVLAKDGVDALQQLQDYTPHVMLVDIEMPRMDGFDLTRNIRGDERYHKIPIIMITSRTADKHRSFALELGVDVYLGKPYQEKELLEHIARFVGERDRATA